MSATLEQPTATLDFDALYRGARDDVYAYVATLLRDRGAAEDVTALAFERAFRKARSYDPGRGGERAWLFGIARNAALDELRRRKRTAALAAEPRTSRAPPPTTPPTGRSSAPPCAPRWRSCRRATAS